MYIPKLYHEEDRQKIPEFLCTNNFPVLVIHDGGKPIATHLPVKVIEGQHGKLTIFGHMSRANPQLIHDGIARRASILDETPSSV